MSRASATVAAFKSSLPGAEASVCAWSGFSAGGVLEESVVKFMVLFS